MKKSVIAFAGLAAIGFSGAAFAGEATTGEWSTNTAPAAPGAAAMSDSQMDGVTAGAAGGVSNFGEWGAGRALSAKTPDTNNALPGGHSDWGQSQGGGQ